MPKMAPMGPPWGDPGGPLGPPVALALWGSTSGAVYTGWGSKLAPGSEVPDAAKFLEARAQDLAPRQ